VLYFIAKYAQNAKFFTVTLQVCRYCTMKSVIYHVKHYESKNSVRKQCESNREFNGNK